MQEIHKFGLPVHTCIQYLFSKLGKFQLSSAKKEIDQLDQDLQKKIKSMENIVRYCVSFYHVYQNLQTFSL